MSDKIKLKAFDDGGADQLLRETMAGHRVEPKPAIWRGISRKLLWTELRHFNFTNLSPKLWLAGTTGLLLIATVLYFGISDDAPGQMSGQISSDLMQKPSSAGIQVAGSSTLSLTPSEQTSHQGTVVTDRLSHAASPEKPSVPGTVMKNPAKMHTPAPQSKAVDAVLSTGNEAPAYEKTSVLSSSTGILNPDAGISPVLPLPASLFFIPLTDTILVFNTPAGIRNVKKSSHAEVQFFSASLGIAPELAFYSEPGDYSKMNFWLNGRVTYNISRFSISTGLGLGYVYDDGQYKAEYLSRDSIGFYNHVTSYTIGTNNEIIYQTQTVTIYDSIQHFGDSRTSNRYAYLQIPLLLGYRFFETNKVSLTFHAGPAVSFLIGSRVSEPDIEYSNARIISVNDETPSRIQTNWQVWANLYLEMRMNKNISLFLEPSFKYYLKPMATQENVEFKAPWTIGLGIGLQFNFGKTK
jgi:hypothetical protein